MYDTFEVINLGAGIRLKELLRDRGMTIKQLSIDSGISLNTLYSITKRDSERIDDVILKRLSDTLGIPTSYLLGGSIRIKDLVKDWHSNKAGRFYMSIDSDLLDLLELFAKEDGLSLEDEVERILHEEAERRIDDRVNEESAKEIQEYYQRRYQSQESIPEDE